MVLAPTFSIFKRRDAYGASVVAEPSVPLLVLYDTVEIFGLVSLCVVLLIAVFSSKVQRTSTWFSFIVAWIFSCLAHLVLLGQQTGPQPEFGLCLFQAAVIYAAAPFCAFSTLAFFLHLHWSISSMVSLSTVKVRGPVLWALLGFPPILLLAVVLEVIVMGLRNPHNVERSHAGMYCHLSDGIATIVSAALVVIAVFAMLVLEVMTFRILYQNWSALRAAPKDSVQGVSFGMIVRVLVFSFYSLIGLILGFVTAVPNMSPVFDAITAIMAAGVPGAAGLLFFTQRDNRHVWMFWKANSNTNSASDESKSTANSCKGQV